MDDLDKGALQERTNCGDGSTEELPFPDKDISPALQRVLKRKFDAGELEGVDREAFLKLLGKSVEETDPSS